MDSYIFLLGWGLVMLLTAVHPFVDPVWSDKCLIAFFAGCTICLLRQKSFPRRDIGLKASWAGPLLIAAYGVTYNYYFNSTLNSALGAARPTAATNALAANMLVFQQVAMASVEGSVLIWLFRGYGLLLVSALATSLWQGPVNIGRLKTTSLKEFLAEAADHYPMKCWWLPAAMYTASHLFIAYAMFRMLRY